uniref:Hypoxia up-regulated protein 1 n=1 Tax=Parastrongyloides trichosuri TaxID=131310 RepID=A0A0N4Z9J5_PARTI
MKTASFVVGFLCLIISLIPVTESAYAVMSVDLGDQFLKIGIVKPGVPMETVLNREFRRKTVNMVGLRNGERHFSDSAANLNVKFPMNSYGYIMDLIGKKFDDPAVKLYQNRFPYHKLSADETRNTVVIETEHGKLPIETILGMILWNCNEVTNVYANQKVKNAIFTVPSYYTQAEKDAIAVAAEIAGINLLKIITEGSAIGLNYGVFRMNEINDTKSNMLIYDIGASKTTAVIIEYQQITNETSKVSYPLIKTLGFGYDRNLGGFELTLRLRDYLIEGFKKTHKTSSDISQNPRAMSKMLKEAERLKQVLSANTDHKAQIENVFEDQDFKMPVTRQEFVDLFTDLDDRWTKPIDEALKMAGMTLDNIDKFVLFGGGTRVPKILDILGKYLNGKEIGRFINTDEAASLGALYHGAYLTKGFQVKRFEIEERDDIIEKLSEENKIEKMSEEEIKSAISILKEFETKEREKAERDAAHNNLEASVYSSKDLLENADFTQYATEDEISTIREKIEQVNLWLEDEVTLETTSAQFKEKSKIIEDTLKPINSRKKQHTERPKKIRVMNKVLNETAKFIESVKNLTELISEEDIKTLQTAYNTTIDWWTSKSEDVKNTPPNKDAPVSNSEISEKAQTLKREWKFLENKLKAIYEKILRETAEKEAAARKAAEEAAKSDNMTKEEKENKTITPEEVANNDTSENTNDTEKTKEEEDKDDIDKKSHILEEL